MEIAESQNGFFLRPLVWHQPVLVDPSHMIEMNFNSKLKLLDRNHMTITTYFTHTYIHKFSWRFPSLRCTNQCLLFLVSWLIVSLTTVRVSGYCTDGYRRVPMSNCGIGCGSCGCILTRKKFGFELSSSSVQRSYVTHTNLLLIEVANRRFSER